MAERLQVLKYYLYYKYKKPFADRSRLKRWQQRQLKTHLRYVGCHSPVYRRRFTLEDYPVIDKAFMMKHFNRLNTAGIRREEAEAFAVLAERSREFTPKLKGVTVGLSSGTSGSRGIFLVSDREKSQWAGYVLARFLPGSILDTYSIAFFMRADSNLYQAVGAKNIRFHFFDILKPVEEHQERLQAAQPRILAGQPSLLLMLGELLEKGELEIRPQIVISIAEVLEEEDAQRLRRVFSVPVIHQVYQCTEGFLASTCRYGTLHLNEDIVYVEKEYLEEGRFVPVITDFARKAQPIIRYRLNDILIERKERCPCGSPFTALQKIEGREDDIFVFAGIHGGQVRVFPDFIRRCLLFAGSSGDYRAVQTQEGTIRIYADLENKQQKRIEEEFEKLAGESGFILPDLTFCPYMLESKRKMKRVERERRSVHETTQC